VSGNVTLGDASKEGTITMTSGGTLQIGGSFTKTVGSTFTAGTGTVDYNGSAAQTINLGVNYFNLKTNNSNGSGATISTAITSTNVTGDFTIESGIFDNGGNAIGGNVAKSFSIVNGATFKISGTTGSGMVTGFGTKTFGATSTVEYSGTIAAQTISAETYGHLTLSGSGNKNLSAGTTTIAGTFKNTGGTMVPGTSTVVFTGASGIIDGAASLKQFNNLQINSGASVTTAAGAGNIQVDGNFSNNGSFVQNSAQTITFNQASGTKNLSTSGSPTTSFGSVVVQGAHTTNAGIDFTVTGNSFNVSNASGSFSGGTKTVTFGGSTILGSGNGTISFNNLIITGTLGNYINNKNFSVSGNWTNNGSFLTGTETITFNGAANQSVAGTGGSTFNNVTINNSGTNPNNVVTFSGSKTVKDLSLTSGVLALAPSGILSISSGGTLSRTAGTLSANSSNIIIFFGSNVISGTFAFDAIVSLLGSVNFGTSSTINNSLSMNSGAVVTGNAPSYSSNSLLFYSPGVNFSRGLEWSTTSGQGYPYNVTLSGNFVLNMGANPAQIAGNLSIGTGSSLDQGANANSLKVLGNVDLQGTLVLSSNASGNME
jgi:hypothetical protein